MALSKQYISENNKTICFDIERLANALKKNSRIEFAYLLGSAQTGTVKPNSDLDIAIYVSHNQSISNAKLDVYDICEKFVPNTTIDIGILNKCLDPIYRFEVISGKLLFYKNQENWLRFYSITCREYEHQIFHYKKQRKYRANINLELEGN